MVDNVLPRVSRTSLTSYKTVWSVSPSMVPRGGGRIQSEIAGWVFLVGIY